MWGRFFGLLTIGIVIFSTTVAYSATPGCGGDSQVKCTFAEATKHGDPSCPSGSFFDPRNGGECWSCPDDYNRTGRAVTHAEACKKPRYKKYKNANKKKKSTVGICPSGQWVSLHNGYCYKCPSSYSHDITKSGNSSKVCYKWKSAKFSTATKEEDWGCSGTRQFPDPRNGGECWSCPERYDRSTFTAVTDDRACTIQLLYTCDPGKVLTGGRCYKSGKCGKKNQRPCLLWERIPSCDSGLYEDFGDNKCKRADAGTSPFLAALRSLLAKIDGFSDTCQETLDIYPSFAGDIASRGGDMTASCSSAFTSGFVCAFPGLAGRLENVLSAGEWMFNEAANLEIEIDAREALDDFVESFDSQRCETVSPLQAQAATYHAKAGMFEGCPDGQFWDPRRGGECWSCPADTNRTVYAVNGNKACTVPGALAMRAACTAIDFVVGDEIAGAVCLNNLIKDGLIDDLKSMGGGGETDTRALCTMGGEIAFDFALEYAIMKKAKNLSRNARKNAIRDLVDSHATGEFATKMLEQSARAGLAYVRLVKALKRLGYANTAITTVTTAGEITRPYYEYIHDKMKEKCPLL
jgi:hypothetical protein